jgi:hypothetical protein
MLPFALTNLHMTTTTMTSSAFANAMKKSIKKNKSKTGDQISEMLFSPCNTDK